MSGLTNNEPLATQPLDKLPGGAVFGDIRPATTMVQAGALIDDSLLVEIAATAITRLEDNENLPVTPEQIAASALEAVDAGAAILHLHVRHPDGRPSMELDGYRELVRLIRAKNTA